MAGFTRVAALSELPPGGALAIEVAGRALALFRVGDAVHALEGECTHAGGPLSEGDLEGCVLTCPWHAATFDVSTGKALSRPASVDLARYATRVEGDDVLVELP